MKFLEDIKASVDNAGLSLTDVLAEAKVDNSTWWRWETGKYSPRLATIQKIDDAIAKLSRKSK